MKHTAMNAAIGIPITTNAAEPASTVCLIALLILFFVFWFRVISYSGVHPRARLWTGQEVFQSRLEASPTSNAATSWSRASIA